MNLVVNVDKNWAIGNNGELLVVIKGDMQHFKQLTTGKVVILGRETLKTFPGGKPLKNRLNIIMTRDKNYTCEDAIIAHSVEELFDELRKHAPEDVFVIGGEIIYNLLLPYVTKAYITKFDRENPADKYFPNLDTMPGWNLAESSETHKENGIQYAFHLYVNEAPLKY